jgi:hypothetical protein
VALISCLQDVNKNSTLKKDSKMNQPVAKPVATIANNHVMVVVAAVAVDTAADAAAAAIAENDKCSRQFAQLAELKHKFRLNQIRLNPFIAVTALKSPAIADFKI